MTKTPELVPSSPAVVFSLSLNLDGTKENYNQLQLQYHIPLDMEQAEMDKYLDKIMAVVGRRKEFYRLEQLERSLHEHEAYAVNAEADLNRLHQQKQDAHVAAGGKGRYKPSMKDGQQIVLAKNNLQNTEVMIERIKTQIQVARKKLGVTGPANS